MLCLIQKNRDILAINLCGLYKNLQTIIFQRFIWSSCVTCFGPQLFVNAQMLQPSKDKSAEIGIFQEHFSMAFWLNFRSSSVLEKTAQKDWWKVLEQRSVVSCIISRLQEASSYLRHPCF